ncbi:MAG: GNAT family N-acetyltransferase [Bacteroidota bacterium]
MKGEIIYKLGFVPDTDQLIDVLRSSGINRPITERERISKMFLNSNLLITAWDGNLLVGVSRSLTDFCYCCYLSDLAVRSEYQHSGIGSRLIGLTREHIGPGTSLILLAAVPAMDYYPNIGFEKISNGFIIKRKA